MAAAILTLLALAPAQAFPLEEGTRWVYESKGRETLVLEMDARRRLGYIQTHQLRIRGRSALFGPNRALFLKEEEDGALYIRARGDPEFPFRVGFSRLFLRFPLHEGLRLGSAQSLVQGIVQHQESVEVPAGRFRAWKIRYGGEDAYSEGVMVLAWLAPGTGFVRIEEHDGDGTSRVFSLTKILKDRRKLIPPSPLTDEVAARVDTLIRRLGSESYEEREKAEADLKALGHRVVGHLERRVPQGRDPEVRARLRRIIADDAPLRLTLRKTRSRIGVGDPIPVQFRICNVSHRTLFVVPSMYGSDVGNRAPTYRIEIVDDRQAPVSEAPPMRIKSRFKLRPPDFFELRPGEEMSPFGGESRGHYMLEWRPTQPGRYTVRFTYDTEFPSEIEGTGIESLLKSTPRGCFVSNTVTFEVGE